MNLINNLKDKVNNNSNNTGVIHLMDKNVNVEIIDHHNVEATLESIKELATVSPESIKYSSIVICSNITYLRKDYIKPQVQAVSIFAEVTELGTLVLTHQSPIVHTGVSIDLKQPMNIYSIMKYIAQYMEVVGSRIMAVS